MAQNDWAFLSNILTIAQVDNGVTSGTSKPTNGGNFVYGFNSLQNVDGVVGLHTSQINFAPLAKGGSIRFAVKRGPSAGPLGSAPFAFICAGASDTASVAYMLGLGDGDPYRITLRKGIMTGGLPDSVTDPDGADGILLRSAAAFAASAEDWHHLRLDAIVQGTGDVLVQAYQNDLSANGVDNPTWVVIPGMEGDQSPAIVGFVDDLLGVNTNSPPLTGGFVGFGFEVSEVSRRGFFDHLEVARQL